MAANFLGLLIFVIGLTGISSTLSRIGDSVWSNRPIVNRFNGFDSYRNRGWPYYPKYPKPFGCENGICSSPGFKTDGDLDLNGRRSSRIERPFFRNTHLLKELPDLKVNTSQNLNFGQHYRYRPFGCKYYRCRYPGIPVRGDLEFSRKKYPERLESDLINRQSSEEIPDLKVNIDNSDVSRETVANSMERDDIIQRHTTEVKNQFKHIKASSADESGDPTKSSAHFESNIPSQSPEAFYFTSIFHVTGQKLQDFKILSSFSESPIKSGTVLNSDIPLETHRTPLEANYESSTSMKKENFVENESKFSAQTSSISPKYDAMELSIENKKVKDTSEFITNIPSKNEQADNVFVEKKEDRLVQNQNTFSTQTLENSRNYNAPESSTENEIVKGTSKVITSTLPKSDPANNSFAGNTKNRLVENQSTFPRLASSLKDITTESSTESEKAKESSFTSNTKNRLIENQSAFPRLASAHEGITEESSMEDLETESIISRSSATFKSESSSASEFKSTTSETLESLSTSESSSNKAPLILFTDDVIEDKIEKILSTDSSLSKTQVKSNAVTEDHVIEISSVKIARIVITSVFLVIALTAFTVFAVYIFRLKRKAVHYDQLLLIP